MYKMEIFRVKKISRLAKNIAIYKLYMAEYAIIYEVTVNMVCEMDHENLTSFLNEI